MCVVERSFGLKSSCPAYPVSRSGLRTLTLPIPTLRSGEAGDSFGLAPGCCRGKGEGRQAMAPGAWKMGSGSTRP